jgi:hypothetical protein
MKKTTLVTIFIFTLIPITVKAQDYTDYYYKLHQADLVAKSGALDSALAMYEDAFKDVDYVLSRILLKKAIPLAKAAKDKTLVKKYKNLYNSQEKCPQENIYILQLLDSIMALDQKVRAPKYLNAQQYVFKYKDDSAINKTEKFLESKRLYDHSAFVDSSNIVYLLDLINKYGFIGEEMLGLNNYSMTTAIILLHYDKDTNNVDLGPILKKALLEFKISPLSYALIIDRHLYYVSKCQRYWTWFMLGADSRNSDPELSAQEINEIIRLREGIGLWGTQYKIGNYRGVWMLNNLSKTVF